MALCSTLGKVLGVVRRTWRAAFILAVAKYGEVEEARLVVGVGRSTVYDLRRTDEAFRRQWDEAIEQYERELVACVAMAPKRFAYR